MKRVRLQVYCCMFFLLLNYPLASLFNKPIMVSGIPLMYVYLFGVWLLFIITMIFIIERSSKTEAEPYE